MAKRLKRDTVNRFACVMLLTGLLTTGAMPSSVVVRVLAGEQLFSESQWVRQNLDRGVSGWISGSVVISTPYVLRDTAHLSESHVSHTLPIVSDSDFAYGVRAELPPSFSIPPDTLLIELGEVARAEAYAVWCTPKQAETLRARAWKHIDTLLARISASARKQGATVWVIGEAKGNRSLNAFWGLGMGAGVVVDRRTGERLRVSALAISDWRAIPIQKGVKVRTQELLDASQRWRAKHTLTEWGRRIVFGLWAIGLLWSAWSLAHRVRPTQRKMQGAEKRLRKLPVPTIILALGVASLFPALWGNPTPISAGLTVFAGLLLLMWLGQLIDTVEITLGTIAGLGILALFLDTLSSGLWNRDGLLGVGALNPNPPVGLSEAHAGLILGWAFLLSLAWVRIEGSPIGLAYALGLLCVWMGWHLGDGGLTLATVILCGGIGGTALYQEIHSRRRVRMMMQGSPARVVPIPHERRLYVAVGLFVGMLVAGMWLSWRQGWGRVAWAGEWSVVPLLGACLLFAWASWRQRLWERLPLGLRRAGLGASVVAFLGLRFEAGALIVLHMVLAILAGEQGSLRNNTQLEEAK